MTYEEVKKDYEKLKEDYGEVVDWTGVFDEISHDLLKNPTKSNAKKWLIKIIKYGFTDGLNWAAENLYGRTVGVNTPPKLFLIEDDEFLIKMYIKYCC